MMNSICSHEEIQILRDMYIRGRSWLDIKTWVCSYIDSLLMKINSNQAKTLDPYDVLAQGTESRKEHRGAQRGVLALASTAVGEKRKLAGQL